MRVSKIRIKNFKSIYDELTIDFDNVHGFWKISGPVGAGKTTIGEAIIFGLFGTISGKSNESLISWGEKRSLLETWCTSRGHDIYIKREINKYGQSPIYITVDGEELVFTNKRDGQQQLENEYYDISRTTLELLCIISFNNFKSLATLNSADTKKFLDQVLGFSILSQYTDTCRELRKIPYQESLNLLRQIDSNKDQIDKITELSNIARIEGDIQEVENNIRDIKSRQKTTIDELNKRIDIERKKQTELQAQLAQIKTLGTNKKKEIDFIKKGKCPTCGAEIDQSQLPIKEQERKVFLAQYKEVSEQIENQAREIKELISERELKDAGFHNEWCTQSNFLVQLKEQEKRSKINLTAIDQLKDENIELQKQADILCAEDEQWLELQNILSEEVRSKILQSFIPSLNKNILNYTNQLHIPYVIEFDTNFKCSIKIIGVREDIPLSSLSTGQLKTVDMCVILGVLDTIMGNISFNITFLDELFSNLDADLRSIMCTVLKQNQNPNQSLFIISHTELDQKYFDGTIDSHMEYMDESHRKSVYKIMHNNLYGDH